MPTDYELTHQGQIIRYQLSAGRSKQGNVSLRVHRDGRVVVSVPPRVNVAEVHRLVASKADWLWQQLTKLPPMASEDSLETRFLTGATHQFLGSPYHLQLQQHDKNKVIIHLHENHLLIYSQNQQADYLEKALYRWYAQQLANYLMQEITDCITTMPWIIQTPPFRLKNMRSRWGSCSSHGNLNFNLHLIKAPLPVIRYVVLHELCHLAEMNHSPRFWQLVNERMPEWQQHRAYLQSYGGELLKV